MKEKLLDAPFYRLYYGQSVDGRGNAEKIMHTFDKKVAKEHLKSINNPYSFGYIEMDLPTGNTIRIYKKQDLK